MPRRIMPDPPGRIKEPICLPLCLRPMGDLLSSPQSEPSQPRAQEENGGGLGDGNLIGRLKPTANV